MARVPKHPSINDTSAHVPKPPSACESTGDAKPFSLVEKDDEEDIDQFMIEEVSRPAYIVSLYMVLFLVSYPIRSLTYSLASQSRKPDNLPQLPQPLVEPTSTVAKQSNRREGFESFEYLASNKDGIRIMKKIEVHEEAAPVLQASKTRYQDNAQKLSVSFNTIAMRRNSTGKNPEMNNVLSSLLIIAAGNPMFGEFFDADSLRANQIQNVIAKHNINISELRAFATTAYNIVKQFRKPKNNQWLKQSILQRPDYGGHNFLSTILVRLRELNVIAVTDGTDINAENAKVKKIYLISSLLTLGNEDACRQIVTQSTLPTMERFDCRNCNNAIANNGGGGQYCLAHIPTVSHIQLPHFFPRSFHPLILSIIPHSDSTAPFPMRTGRQTDGTTCQIRAGVESKANLEMYLTERKKTGTDVQLK